MHEILVGIHYKPGEKVKRVDRKKPYIVETVRLELMQDDSEPSGYVAYSSYDIRSLSNKKLVRDIPLSWLQPYDAAG